VISSVRSSAVIALLLLASLAALTQSSPVPPRPPAGQLPQPAEAGGPRFGTQRNQTDPDEERMERERQKHLNKDRFESLRRDTARLLQLSNELKQYVDKASENTLSLDVIRKAEEVEKLAKRVKEKMRAY